MCNIVMLFVMCNIAVHSMFNCIDVCSLKSVIVSAESANDVSRKDPGNQAETRGKLREKPATLADATG